MLFVTIRIVLWLAISIFAVYKIRSLKIVKKRASTILIVIFFMVLLSISAMFPVENLFYNFKSPESVFNYTNSGKIDEIIYGQKSCMVIYSKWNSTGGHYVIPKSEKGYKIPRYLSTKKVSHKFDKDGIFDVYNVKGTNDYYIFGIVHLKENKNQIDVFNKKDEKVESNIFVKKNMSFIYFFIYDFSNEYYLLINGEKVSIY